jgi:hypothetical protein
MTPNDALCESPRGELATASAFAQAHGALRPDDVSAYLAEVFRLAPAAKLDPAIVVAQSAEETSYWTSDWWNQRLNPAGIGITGDATDDANSGTWANGTDAARAQIVHLFVYAVGSIPDGHVLAPFRALDPRYQAALAAGYAGIAKTIAGLSGHWAVDPQYAVNIAQRGNAIFPNLPDADNSGGSTGTITFGNVPHPAFTDRLIPDVDNGAWDNLGQRHVRGVVYHRQLGPNWGTDSYFRTPPPGGLSNCPGPNDPPNFNWGGCNGLTDYGVDDVTGQILRWNDPTGAPHPGVSANRAGWASGPVSSPWGDGKAFLLDNGWDPNGGPNQAALNVVNRDQVSIEISGWYSVPDEGHPNDDPISDACKDSVAALSAYWADQFHIPWDSYPRVPGKDFNFTRFHQQFCIGTGKICPGQLVMNETTDIHNRTQAILKRYQLSGGGGNGEVVKFPQPRTFHAQQGALSRSGPSTDSPQVRTFQPGAAITCVGYVHGQTVDGDDRWLQTNDQPPQYIHTSGVVESI